MNIINHTASHTPAADASPPLAWKVHFAINQRHARLLTCRRVRLTGPARAPADRPPSRRCCQTRPAAVMSASIIHHHINHITSHHITSITSHHITSHHITSHQSRQSRHTSMIWPALRVSSWDRGCCWLLSRRAAGVCDACTSSMAGLEARATAAVVAKGDAVRTQGWDGTVEVLGEASASVAGLSYVDSISSCGLDLHRHHPPCMSNG